MRSGEEQIEYIYSCIDVLPIVLRANQCGSALPQDVWHRHVCEIEYMDESRRPTVVGTGPCKLYTYYQGAVRLYVRNMPRILFCFFHPLKAGPRRSLTRAGMPAAPGRLSDRGKVQILQATSLNELSETSTLAVPAADLPETPEAIKCYTNQTLCPERTPAHPSEDRQNS